MTFIRTTIDEQGQTLYALRDVASQLGMTTITRLLPHIAPLNRHMRNCGGRSALVFVPRASLAPFQDRLDFNGVKAVGSVQGFKAPRRAPSNDQAGHLRTIPHPKTGETLYSIYDVAKQLGRQTNSVLNLVPRDQIVKTRIGASRQMLFAPASAFGQVRELVDFHRSNKPIDPNVSLFDQLVMTKVRKLPHPKHPDCWEPLAPSVTIPGLPGMHSLRRTLYSLATGTKLTSERLRPEPTCWATLGYYGPGVPRQIRCCNPAHQSLVRSPLTPATPSRLSAYQEFLVEQLNDERPDGPWTRTEVETLAADFGIPADAVEGVIEHLGLGPTPPS